PASATSRHAPAMPPLPARPNRTARGATRIRDLVVMFLAPFRRLEGETQGGDELRQHREHGLVVRDDRVAQIGTALRIEAGVPGPGVEVAARDREGRPL